MKNGTTSLQTACLSYANQNQNFNIVVYGKIGTSMEYSISDISMYIKVIFFI